MSEVCFTINGKEYKVKSVEADTSLNSYLRNNANLRGTKAMCHEGGCGACVVSVSAIHPVKKEKEVFSVNSCLVSILSCHGWDITTVEGIGNRKKGYHPIQKRLANFNGTQCGYCSPGWVMNMYSLHESRKHNLTMKEVENSFAGSLCRCTGYRPILDAFKSFSKDADQSLLDQVLDIEEVEKVKMCAKSGQVCKCPSSCSDKTEDGFCDVEAHNIIGKEEKLLSLKASDSKWYKVYNIKDILDIFNKEGTDSYMLISGNTAQGVYPMKTLPKIMIDIASVSDLRKHEKTSNLSLGGNMSLNEIMLIFQDYGKSNDEFKYLLQMYRHMDLIAHVPVRNIGSLAGNLSIKHQHNDFQSDMFLLLEAVGATMTIIDKHGTYTEVSLLDYLKTDMHGKLIYRVNLPELYPDYVFHSYKIMPRAQNAHAIVNSAFLFKFNQDKTEVESARIVYGAIRPEFNHARTTEKFLVGKNIFSKAILNQAIHILHGDIDPEDMPPEPSPEYRRLLAIGLFYKCILHICPSGLIKDNLKSGGEEFDRPVSSGKQDFDTNKKVWPLNQPIPKIEALVQCSGEGFFMNDLPTQPNEVYAAFVISNVHDGQIDKIDGSEAMADKRVIALYTASDIPGVNNFASLPGLFVAPEEVLSSGKILFHGQPVAVIVAETERLAKLAAEKVKVTYKNTGANAPILTVRDVLKSPSAKDRIVKDMTIEPTSKGSDVKQVIKGTLDIFGQYHYTMEPQTCVCVPIEDGMDVYSSSQWPDLTNVCVANVLNVPVNTINVRIRRLGGAYGAKISRSAQVAAACAVAAKILNRTVRFVMPIETNMSAVGKRLPCSCDYEVGINDDGKIQYLRNIFYEDDGCSHNENLSKHAAAAIPNCYDNSTWFVEANSVLTDTPANTWCRAPGTTEAIAMTELIMDHIATVTGKDRLDVRMLNMSPKDNPMPDLIKTIKASSNYDERAANVKQFNDTNRWKKRGICLTPLKYELDYFGNYSSLVSIYHDDGTVAVSHAGVEMGQGMHTKVAQVCAHTLGIPLETVQVKPTNNLTAPNAMVTGGSSGSEVCSFATIKACEILLERLAPIKKDMKDPTWKELIKKAYLSGVDLCAHYMFTVADGVKPYSIWAASVIDVEVDMLTGNHQILRVDILEDTGESLSPIVDVGQVEGAYVMGIGYWTSESLVYDKKTGALLSNRTWTYKPPGVKDIPIDFRVEFRRNAPNPAGVLRSKATGEPPLNMAFGIVSALRQAITSTRVDNGLPANEWYHIDMPLTTENIILATKTSINDFET